MTKDQQISFLATLPDKGGVRIDRDGGRLVLEFDAQQVQAIVALAGLGRDVLLQVTVEEAAL